MIDRGVWWMVVDAYIGTFLIKLVARPPCTSGVNL